MAGEKPDDLESVLGLETALRQLTNKIHSSTLDEIITTVRGEIQRLLGADRVTLYVRDAVRNEIYSKVKDGTELREIRLPIKANSIAGFVAKKQKAVRLRNVYDEKECASVDPDLRFDSSWDKKSGYHTRQVLAVPIMTNGRLHGVIQAVNKRGGGEFTAQDERIATELAQTLAIAFQNQKRMTVRRSRYDVLFDDERINEDILEEARRRAREEDVSVEKVLIERFKVPKEAVLESLATFYRCEALSFSPDVPIPVGLLEHFQLDYLKHHRCVPIKEEGGKVYVLMENPGDIVTRDDLTVRMGGKTIVPLVGIREDIIAFIDLFYAKEAPAAAPAGTPPEDLAALVQQLDTEYAGLVGAEEKEGEEAEEVKEDDSGIVRLVNQIIETAYAKGASDIHIEPYPEQDMVVRFRIDGVCREYTRLPRKFSRAIVSRIKIMSGLDIAERRLPQDGKIKFKNYGRLDIELRVAVIPTVGGQEDVVMRILASSKPIPLDQIGMIPQNYERFKKVIEQPYGILLCVGPTGSGKTTTLHSALGYINEPEWKIWTAEDPVEITQVGLRQVQIHHKIGYTFERALRAFLRADPDVIMVGEMRDRETAQAGIEASLTGHLVFSTLHTNSAPETITRLLDMDIDPFSFGDSLLAVLAQRLVRTLCKNCKQPYTPDEAEWAELKGEFENDARWRELGLPEKPAQLMKPGGCEKCNQTGYKGRMGIHELLVVNDEIRAMIFRKAKVSEIRDAAVAHGMLTLKQDGIVKVVQGHTTLREVRSVCMR